MKMIPYKTARIVLLSLCLTVLIACTAPEADKPSSKTSFSEVHVQGVPGGITTTTTRMTAKVSAIDYDKRRVTLEDDQGNKKTLVIGPEAINFNQVQKGDIVMVTVASELVVHVRGKGEPANDGVAALAGRAPEGNKPAAVMAGTVEETAIVKAIDLKAHTATLQFSDGSQQVVAVRPDVDLSKAKIDTEVVIRMTAAVAIAVEKP
jgi:hypothetical protein